MISVQLIGMENPLYQEESELRNKILLRPIGVPDHAWEMNDAKAWHFAALDGNLLVGCVVLVPLNERSDKAQLIQMAVETDRQRQGIGRLLAQTLLQFALERQIAEILVHARADTVEFYSKLGFETYGEAFEEVGIQHRHMRMPLKKREEADNQC